MFERFDALRDDVRYALRQLRRAPAFSAALALTFALGIGANATMFRSSMPLLFRPPAFMADADRVGRVYLRYPTPDGSERIDVNISYLRYTELREKSRAFETTAAVFQDENRIVGTGTAAEAIAVGLVSGSFWGLFDVRPAVSRFFTVDEDKAPNGTNVAVLSWVLAIPTRRRFRRGWQATPHRRQALHRDRRGPERVSRSGRRIRLRMYRSPPRPSTCSGPATTHGAAALRGSR